METDGRSPATLVRSRSWPALAAAAALATALVAVPGAAWSQDASYADFNHDGEVSSEEGSAFADLLWSSLSPDAAESVDPKTLLAQRPEFARLLKIATPRRDGLIYKIDFRAALDARFKAADKNGDGVLDAREIGDYLPNGA